MNIGILIYEDNKGLRDSLEQLVSGSEKLLLLGSFDNAVNVLKDVPLLKPDVILMDIDMPGITGIEAVSKLRQSGHTIPVIMLTIFDDNKHVLDAIFAGASGYLQKKHISERLVDAIGEVLAGGAPMSPAIARLVIENMQQKNVDLENRYNLTPREKEILQSLSKGNSYKLIAAEFNISIDTVRTHIKRIYEKLQVHSQTEAISKAMSERIV